MIMNYEEKSFFSVLNLRKMPGEPVKSGIWGRLTPLQPLVIMIGKRFA